MLQSLLEDGTNLNLSLKFLIFMVSSYLYCSMLVICFKLKNNPLKLTLLLCLFVDKKMETKQIPHAKFPRCLLEEMEFKFRCQEQ